MYEPVSYVFVKTTQVLGILFWVTEQDLGHKTEIPVAITMDLKKYMLIFCYSLVDKLMSYLGHFVSMV
jgi:hypothetical protein